MKKEEESPEQGLSFGAGNSIAAVGTLSGLAIAIGVPWVLLVNGQSLGSPVLTTLIIIALCIGGLVSLVSAFFGLVIPRHIHGRWMDPERWRDFARDRDWARDWDQEGRRRGRAKRGD